MIFSHRGKHYTLPPAVPYRGFNLEEITLVPRPLRQPVECWQPIVSAGARGLDFMIKHRIRGEQLAWLGREVMPSFVAR